MLIIFCLSVSYAKEGKKLAKAGDLIITEEDLSRIIEYN